MTIGDPYEESKISGLDIVEIYIAIAAFRPNRVTETSLKVERISGEDILMDHEGIISGSNLNRLCIFSRIESERY